MNLVICHTPLQMLIASHLIAQLPETPFEVWAFAYTRNVKTEHYYARLTEYSQRADYAILTPKQPLSYARTLCYIKKRFSGRHYETVFVSSINSLVVHLLLSCITFDRLETFDDGTGNITPSSVFYRNEPPSLLRRCVQGLCGICFDTATVRKVSCRHHTLYPDSPNIIEHTVPLTLLPEISVQVATHKRQKILLGQPLLPNAADNIALAHHLLHELDITHYYPHPREDYRVPNVAYIDTPLIFEDWLVQAIQTAPDTHFEIYHLFSTAALNVANLPNISLYAIDLSECMDIKQTLNRTLFEQYRNHIVRPHFRIEAA
ncbi:MAG: glycosyltransferase family 52 [Alysiella sp.]|uniref:glycosyltransferase family 52 n=1 Tax=Alysiella sp. TaxID=1872483 RepID=UPI0026DCDBCB|nr:glycosyltransferase family 52 [Alysiella sp.]MDO4433505.1 glycosyltransferase family 52 [Alysiella sp.]